MALAGSGKKVVPVRQQQQRMRDLKREMARRMLLESLEGRQLMAVGPQLIGIQPNEGSLITDGQVLHVSPRELVFRFDDGDQLDATTLNGIQISRTGGDGIFDRAYFSTDLGTSAQVVLDFSAQTPGLSGNGIELKFTKVSRTDTSAPVITVSGSRVNVEVNSAPGFKTTAQDLIRAFDNSGPASALVKLVRLRGSEFTVIADTVPVNQVLTLMGANAAKASTNFGSSVNLQVEFVARNSGADGRNIQLVFTSRDMGGQAPPNVSVTGTTIKVELNSNALFASTAKEAVDAVNNNAQASALVLGRFISGVPATRIGILPTSTYSPIRLAGASDVPVIPAYRGLGDTQREVIFRFAEELPDDIYQVDILGRGATPLKNVSGLPFNGGADKGIGFELDLGAKILSVVPQPIVRDELTDTMTQLRNQIYVYYNDDDLNVASAQNPDFYQLRYTFGTANSNDDVVLKPTRVVYDAALDRAVLTFARNLDTLVDGSGNALPIGAMRLRIGTNEEKLPAPNLIKTSTNPDAAFDATKDVDPGSRFNTAQDISAAFSPSAGQPKAVVISSQIKNTTPYTLDFPGANDEPGNRSTRYADHVKTVDSDGIEIIEYNFQGELGRTAGSIQLNAITETQKDLVRQIMSLWANYLGVRFVETASRGMTIAVGDMRAVVGGQANGPGNGPNDQTNLKLAAGPLVSNGQLAVVIDIQDFNAATDNQFGTDLFRSFMQGVGLLLGLGTDEELPNLSVMSNQPIVGPGVETELTFPGNQDIVHGQYVHRPEGKDIDLYRFSLPVAGELKVETFSERLQDSSLLNTALKLYQLQPDGSFKEIAANDDYYSEDSLIRVQLPAGTYMVGVSAQGNENYDPNIEDSGLGGRSEGRYDLRLDFRPPEASFMVDDNSDGDGSDVRIDGDGDGRPGGAFDFWFVPTGPSNTLYVDKGTKSTTNNGGITTPYKNIKDALRDVKAGQVIRIVGNGGADNNLATVGDNLAYEIGFNRFGQALADGTEFNVPKDVTVMIDAGAILKLSRARISVGSSTVSVDRSGSSLQSLGIPRLIDVATGKVITDLNGDAVPGSVYFTSLNDLTIGKGVNPDRTPPAPGPGDWGGLDFRNEIDGSDESRKDLERSGVFLNAIVHSDLRYGGGQVLVDGVSQVITPIHMMDSRPSVVNNIITRSADAAMSATPNSFKESNFQDPRNQAAGAFIADFERIGPDIHGNRLVDNSINGLFVQVRTGAGSTTESMTVSGRFDDLDIVHVVSENLTIQGTNGGSIQDSTTPPTTITTLTPKTGGTLAAGSYNYKLVYVDSFGNESPASEATQTVTVAANGAIDLANLPAIKAGLPFVSRRLYRSSIGGVGPYVLVSQLNAVLTNFTDLGSNAGTPLVETIGRLRPRLNGSLMIDPGIIIKAQGSRIEVQGGGQLIAEGTDGLPIVMTSADDRRYGAGGTYDTFKRTLLRNPSAGDWGGIYVGVTGSLALDYARVAYGGGTTRIEGGFATFNAVELHQADARIAHSRFEFNSNGVEGSTTTNRSGRGTNFDGTIFVRGSQPVIVDNDIVNGTGAAINIDVNSLNWQYVTDPGRSSGLLQTTVSSTDNHGPLIEGNRLTKNRTNGMIVRGQTLTTESIWDDTDMVHVVLDEVTSSNFHAYGGLRLESKPSSSLVVKFQSRGNSAGGNGSGSQGGAGGTAVTLAGLNATGLPLDFTNRIGGSVQIIGQPGFPVVLTALSDDSVGAGFTTDGMPNVDTDGNNANANSIQLLPTGPEQNNGTLIDDDVAVGIPGQFAFRAGAGGQSGFATNDGVGGGITAQGVSQLISNSDAIFEYFNYIDVGGDGQAVNLARTTITQPPTLVSDDLVVSSGTFTGNGGATVRWRIESRMDDGIAKVINTLTLDSDAPLGNIRFINYLDEDILGPSDDFLYTTGTPGQPNFRAFTLDGPQRVGFSQGGVYSDGSGLVNATYDGWAADKYSDLQDAIENGGSAYSVNGVIDTSDLTPFVDSSLGQAYGLADVTTAFAWSVSPTATSATITSFLELVSSNPSTTALAGDWNGVTLQTYSNDRNVSTTNERETSGTNSIGTNDVPNSSQYLGQIAKSPTSGDENTRLGFEVHGTISKPSDLDVYSFTAYGGTEVWLDIDHTSDRLDTVVELIDANGNILALSNDSNAEEAAGSVVYQSNALTNDVVHPMRKTTTQLFPSDSRGNPRDLYSTNPKDSGFRVRLPGQTTEATLYHVRVRSSSILTGEPVAKLIDPAQTRAGLSTGSYELQIRLTENDEIPGSTVSYGDIRFATNGLTLAGVPRHSPLVGEVGENEARDLNRDGIVDQQDNNTFANAQEIGNLLTTDRAALSIAGNLSNAADVDWYTFTIDYQLLLTPLAEYLSTIFDIDSADGIGRADTSMYLFDSNGRLISSGLSSNILDDLAAPLKGADNTDLTRGSSGTLDPYLGSVELKGGKYFLAVSSNGRAPAALDQFLVANATNPLVRLQPASATQLLVEDHVEFNGGSTAAPPTLAPFVDETGVVDWTLSDMQLYVSQDAGLNITEVYIVNPFTGEVSSHPGRINADIRDIAFRPNGGLRGYTNPLESASTGDLDPQVLYVGINPGTAAINTIGPAGLETFDINSPRADLSSNTGYVVEALALGEYANNEGGWFVMNRSRLDNIGYDTNVLYQFNPNSGLAFSNPSPDRRTLGEVILGAGTQIVERGRLRTEANPGDVSRRLVVTEATEVTANTTTPLIRDGNRFTIRDATNFPALFEMNSGPEVTLNYDAKTGRTARDGDKFVIDGFTYEFDTGGVLVLKATTGAGLSDGASVTITDGTAGSVVKTFEFDRNGTLTNPNAIRVPFTLGSTQTQMISDLISAINGAGFAAKAELLGGTNRITVNGKSGTIAMTATGSGLSVEGGLGVASGSRRIIYRETMNQDEFVEAIRSSLPTNITVGYDGTRVNFSGATLGDFTDLANRGIATSTGADGNVLGGAIPVNFLAQDSAATIAKRIELAIANAGIAGVSAVANGRSVNIINAIIDVTPARAPNGGLKAADIAPGGSVTGMALLNNALYAISDQGGLYRLNSPESTFGIPGGEITGTYVNLSSDLLGIRFTGLTAGPQHLENGRYSNLLFGTDVNGNIWAFNENGRLQNVFANGANHVSTGVRGLDGLSFSTLDYNLWHVSSNQSGQAGGVGLAGHGLPATPDGSHGDIPGGSSWYFGFERPGAQPNATYTPTTDPGLRNSVNFPGGAAGVLESKAFSLKGISPADQPYLYFSYLLTSSGVDSSLADINRFMQDSFRVYVGDETGTWSLLTTNNSDRAGGFADDEFDPAISNSGATQEAFDNTATWRQARVNLGEFAGKDNLRLRFEYSTAGSMGWGVKGGRGPEIRTIKAAGLDDGAVLTIGNKQFEIELGTSLTFPSGASIKNGDTVSIDGANFIFFDGSGPPPVNGTIIPFSSQQSANEIAQAFLAAASGAVLPVGQASGLNFSQEGTVANDTLATATSSTITGDSIDIIGTGTIGDNPNLFATPDRDVDLVRMDLDRGATVTIDAVSSSIAPQVDTYLRVFDSNGNELTSNDNFAGTINSHIDFTAPAKGTYYIGVSASGNNAYNPSVLGSSTSGGSAGNYELRIGVRRLFNPTAVGAKVQLEGAKSVDVTPGSAIIQQGSLGSKENAIPLNLADSDVVVARKLRRSIADVFTNGSLQPYALRQEFLNLTGLTVQNAGPFGLTVTKAEDQFSEFSIADPLNRPAIRAQNNNFEGMYLDDFIIGTAERGELVVGGVDNQTNFVGTGQGGIQVGPYQLEIRRGQEYGQPTAGNINLTDTFAVNERLAPGTNLSFKAGPELHDGITFTIGDGIKTVTFEFEDAELRNGVTSGNVAVPFKSTVIDSVTKRRRPTTSSETAAAVRDTINSLTVQSVINVTASMINGDLTGSSNDVLSLFGTATVSIPASAGTVEYIKQTGDQNVNRDQGMIVVENTKFANSQGFGLRLQPDVRNAGSDTPNPGAVRNSVVLNTERLAPGAAVYNNEFMFNTLGGISVAGEADNTNRDPGSIPFAKIYNNTIVGGSIRQDAPASPRVIDGLLFSLGTQAFADAIVSYLPNFGGGPVPATALQTPSQALGIPNYTSNIEPVGGDPVVSLGNGGQLTVRFNDNYLRASGDSRPDLYVREVGDREDVFVEVSLDDGLTYKSVGKIGGSVNTVDLDAFGIVTSARITRVRLTDDPNQGATTGVSVGADIDAVGAITSSLSEIYTAGGTGIVVGENASPTLLNNAIVNSLTGISVATSSSSTVIGGTLFQRNLANIAGGGGSEGKYAIDSTKFQTLFIDPANGIFYPSPSSMLIDSSLDSLEDRTSLIAVKEPLGLQPSPLIAPSTDISGLLRVDDPTVETPSGLGQSVFKDRGASDRADSIGPAAFIINPIDNDTAGKDNNPEEGVVELIGASMSHFDLKLIDSTRNGGVSEGSGINDRTVTSSAILVFKNNVPLVDGVDYRFGYDATNGTVRLTPVAGVWPSGSVYSIRILNTDESTITLRSPESYSDGARFTIIDDTGAQTVIELDLGYQVTVPSTALGINTIQDGSRFTLDDGTRRIVFEYDTSGSFGVGNVPITYAATDTAQTVAEKTVAAIRSQQMNLSASSLDNGRIQIRGSRLVQLINTSSGLIINGKPGVDPAYGLRIPTKAGVPDGIGEGQKFTIRLGNGASATFEFDSNGAVATGNKAIVFGPNSTTDQIADSIVGAITRAGLGLSPQNTGGGFVTIGGDADVRILNNNSVLSIVGTAGIPASRSVNVDLSAITSDTALATLLSSVITNASIPGLIQTQFGPKLLIEGVQGIAGDGANPVSSVQDVIGNPIRANQISGDTVLVIQLGDGFDFGDAPDGPYASKSTSNGPRHKVEQGFSLGPTVSVDGDARLNDGDNDDGVTFDHDLYAAFSTTIKVNVQGVTPTHTAVLVGWIDFDGDGLFENNRERFFVSPPLQTSGDLNIPVAVPNTALTGNTWARFRLSTVAQLNSTGAAPDGEVEDYKVVINADPYVNPKNGLDVNNDGHVSPIDALQVINYVNLNGPSTKLTVPLPAGTTLPPYLDVNADGFISVLDALVVINFLNSTKNPGGEGEANFDGSTWLIPTAAPVGSGNGVPGPETQASTSKSTANASSSIRLSDYLERANTAYGPVQSVSVLADPAVLSIESELDSLIADRPATSPADVANSLDSVFKDAFWE